MIFISAREMIDLPFEDYLNVLRSEFSRSTIDEDQDRLLVNIRGRVPMRKEDIEQGIKLGKEIISQREDEKEQ